MIEGRKCIERQGLAARYWGSSQRLADRPLHGLASPMAELSDAELAAYCDEHLGEAALAAAIAPINDWIASQREPEWDQIADRMNEYLGAWSAPPWTAEEVNTLAMALAMAQEGG